MFSCLQFFECVDFFLRRKTPPDTVPEHPRVCTTNRRSGVRTTNRYPFTLRSNHTLHRNESMPALTVRRTSGSPPNSCSSHSARTLPLPDTSTCSSPSDRGVAGTRSIIAGGSASDAWYTVRRRLAFTDPVFRRNQLSLSRSEQRGSQIRVQSIGLEQLASLNKHNHDK